MKKIELLFAILVVLCAAVLFQSCPNSKDFTSYTVTYDGNGNDSGEAPKDIGSYLTGQPVTIMSPGSLKKNSNSFVKWNSKQDGSGTDYIVNNKFTMPGENITLYAVWTIKPICTVAYYGNGNTSGSIPSNVINYEQGQTVIVCDNTGKLMKTGFVFAGWNTQADGSGTFYRVQNKFDIDAITVELYAQWDIILACGFYFTTAAKSNGSLWAWGCNNNGQLGDGTQTRSFLPKVIGADTNWCQVVCGSDHIVALKTNGTLWGWGTNYWGQLGDGSTTLNQFSVEQIGTETNWRKLACGTHHTAAIKADGSLWAWGWNAFSQLGFATPTEISSTPLQLGTGNNWCQIACGSIYTVAIKKDGTLWAWGYNFFGNLGDGSTLDKSTPVRIGTDEDWSQIACGYAHTIALKTDGSLWAWGGNFDGQLGDGTTTNRYSPVRIGLDTNWIQIACGYTHTTALKTNGTIWTWGDNRNGQLGDGSTINKSSPEQIGAATNWTKTACGQYHTVALNTEGSIWCWGNNEYGQLGDGTLTEKHLPIQSKF